MCNNVTGHTPDTANGFVQNLSDRFPANASEPPELVPVEEQVSEALRQYFQAVICITGVIGGILNLIVMNRRCMRNVTTCAYMAGVAGCDLLTTGSFIIFYLRKVVSPTLLTQPWACRAILVLFYFSIHSSVILIVAMTAERFLAVWFPLKASSWCTLKRARITIVCITVAILGLNMNHLFTRPDVTNPATGYSTCMERSLVMYSSKFNIFHLRVWPWIDAALYSFIPILSLIILNFLILYKLKKATKKHCKITRESSNSSKITRTQTQITVMLLLVTFAFIILTGPVAVMLIVEKYWFPSNRHEEAVKLLVHTVTELMMFCNHAVNFFLYCCGASRFRKELFKICCCYWTSKADTSLSLTQSRESEI